MSFMFRKGSFTKEEEKRKKEVSLVETILEEFEGFRSYNTSQALILAYLA